MSYDGWTKARLVARIEGLESGRSVEAHVLAVVDELPASASKADRARAELALALAREIDDPPSDEKRPPATAAVSKELRALLDQLELVTSADGNGPGVFPSLGHPSKG